jgi:hypothetical protein
MSIKHRKLSSSKFFKNVILACPESILGVLILIHLSLIYFGGYFLSPEFSLYPYLTSLGLKPYLSLVDQHLPVILFGPLSLPKSLVTNPQPLLSLFLSLVAITDLLFYALLKKNKVKNPYLWTAVFAFSSFLFSGNTLWLETFITPIILLLLLLKKNSLSELATGILTALALLTRPTLAPVLLLLLVFKKLKATRFLIAGLLAPFLLTLSYLIFHQTIPSFLNLFFNFNAVYYSSLAGQLPNSRQLFLVLLIMVPALAVALKNKRYLPAVIITLSLLPVWPRFELTHLQPALALAIYFWATANKAKKTSYLFLKILLIFFSIWSVKKVTTVNYGNFYLNKEVKQVSTFLKTQSENQLFILGGSDLIYPLAAKNPAGDYYLPSLPWYYSNKDFVKKQLSALKLNPQSLVVINHSSSLKGQSVSSFASPVFEYIIDQYSPFHQVGEYKIYKIKP